MNNNNDKYRIIFCPKNENECKEAQDILFKNGYYWSGSMYKYKFLDAVNLVISSDMKLIQYTDSGTLLDLLKYYVRYDNDYKHIVVVTLLELKNSFIKKIDYNKPKQLIYD